MRLGRVAYPRVVRARCGSWRLHTGGWHTGAYSDQGSRWARSALRTTSDTEIPRSSAIWWTASTREPGSRVVSTWVECRCHRRPPLRASAAARRKHHTNVLILRVTYVYSLSTQCMTRTSLAFPSFPSQRGWVTCHSLFAGRQHRTPRLPISALSVTVSPTYVGSVTDACSALSVARLSVWTAPTRPNSSNHDRSSVQACWLRFSQTVQTWVRYVSVSASVHSFTRAKWA